MQTSRPSGGKHPVARRRLAVAALLAALLLAINAAIGWVLVPYGGKTELVWHDYRELTSLDTVVIGSSFAQHSVSPRALDDTLGSDSYNLGTPAQSLINTREALATAIDDWHVGRAIYCFEYDTFFEDQWANAAIAFTKYKCEGEPLPQVLRDVGNLVFSDFFFSRHYSLTCAFPWSYEHVPLTWEAVSTNVSNRLNGNIYEAARRYAQITDGHVWDYERTGFVGLRLELDGECVHGFDYSTFEDREFIANNVEYLRQICELCRQNGVQFYMVAPPTAASTLIQYGDAYPQHMTQLKEIVEQAGGVFLDLNLAMPDVLTLDGSDICDLAHLSSDGAKKTSEALGHLLSRIEAGEDVSSSFFSYDKDGWQDYLASVDYVDSVEYEAVEKGDAMVYEASTCTGTQSVVEYLFETRKSADDDWAVAQDWGPDSSYEVAPGDGATQIRISARTQQNPSVVRWVEGDVGQ